MTWEGIIPCKRRKAFERFLQHDDSRILALANEMQKEDRVTRRLMRAEAELDGAVGATSDGAWAEVSQQMGREGTEESDAASGDESCFIEIQF